jgi:hypothetical protein
VLSLIYRFYAAPYLTFLLNQYWPNFSYQQFSGLEGPTYQALFYLGAGLILYIDTWRFLIGNIPETIMGLFLAIPIVIILVAYIKKSGFEKAESKIFRVGVIGLLLTNFIFIVAMYSLMVVRLPYFIEMRSSGYYFLPTTAMFSMTFAFLLSRVVKIQSIPKWVIFTFLFLAIAGNAIAIPQRKFTPVNGIIQPYFQYGQKLIGALKNINNPQYPVGPEIEKDSIYQFFQNNP